MTPDPSRLYHLMFDHYGPQHWWPARTDVEMMVGAILVQNTAWTQAAKAVRQLEDRGLLDFHAILTTPDEQLWPILQPAGYFRIKTKRLKSLATFMVSGGGPEAVIRADNDGLRANLLGVHGVGRETADSIVCYAARQPVFVVDAYTKRLFLRLSWIDSRADYDTMQALVHGSSLPREADTLGEFHALIVRHAKEHCRKRPHCPGCPVTFCLGVASHDTRAGG
ncbi:MAG: endonuclease [Magnetococcales bacterium]|nr:endonuclease [Magnetococcales bacterium]